MSWKEAQSWSLCLWLTHQRPFESLFFILCYILIDKEMIGRRRLQTQFEGFFMFYQAKRRNCCSLCFSLRLTIIFVSFVAWFDSLLMFVICWFSWCFCISICLSFNQILVPLNQPKPMKPKYCCIFFLPLLLLSTPQAKEKVSKTWYFLSFACLCSSIRRFFLRQLLRDIWRS